MIIRNGLVFGKDCKFVPGDILVKGDVIADVSRRAADDLCPDLPGGDPVLDGGSSPEEVDASGMYIIPGLTDIHFHGCGGYDFCEGTFEAIEAIAKEMLSGGITTICPATMTLSKERLFQICAAARAYDSAAGAQLVGIHLEGPFLSGQKCGAQNKEYLMGPDADLFLELQEAAGGLIKIADIAPELEGAADFIGTLKDRVHISLAHSAADYDTAMRAFELGADHVTHLFNAMPPFHHRDTGIVGAACDSGQVYVELIGDGIHCSPSAVRAAFKMFGADRIVLISDSMRACGQPDGLYELGGQEVFVKGKIAALKDGTIAGSVTNLMDGMRILVREMGIPIEDAVRCAAVNPAKAIGIYDRFGSIENGKCANLVALDRDLEIRFIVKNGIMYRKNV